MNKFLPAILCNLLTVTVALPSGLTDQSLQKITPVVIELSQTSENSVTRISKIVGVLGMFAGFAYTDFAVKTDIIRNTRTYSEPLRAFGNTALSKRQCLEKAAFVTLATLLSAAVSHFIGKAIATRSTPEKKSENLINDLIYKNNRAIEAHDRVNLDEASRIQLSASFSQGVSNEQARIDVYKIMLEHAQEEAAKPYFRKGHPVGASLTALKAKASELAMEKYEATKLLTQIGTPFTEIKKCAGEELAFSLVHIINQAKRNANKIVRLNNLLPVQKVQNWLSQAKKLPEAQRDFETKKLCSEKIAELQQYENDLRLNLAQLAALHTSATTIGKYVFNNLSVGYPDNNKGREQRNKAIAKIKNHASRLMTEYQEKARAYSNTVIHVNHLNYQIPESVKQYIVQHGGSIDIMNGFETDQKLLTFNSFLNHNDASLLPALVDYLRNSN